jgi:hypothetical protein
VSRLVSHGGLCEWIKGERKSAMRHDISHVPVFVDSTAYADKLKMTRCIYFHVEHTGPETTTYLEFDDAPAILLLNVEGVIVSGLRGRERLDTPEAIGELFEFLDEQTPYVVTAGYLWLPNQLLETCVRKELSRGDVLRVYTPLFVQAWAATGSTREIPPGEAPPDVQPVYLSEEETAAFNEWTRGTVERVRRRYRERPEMNLRTRHQRRGA